NGKPTRCNGWAFSLISHSRQPPFFSGGGGVSPFFSGSAFFSSPFFSPAGGVSAFFSSPGGGLPGGGQTAGGGTGTAKPPMPPPRIPIPPGLGKIGLNGLGL